MKRKQKFEEGLALLYAHRLRGHCYSLRTIGAWCGVTGEAIRQIEQRALRKLRLRMNHALQEGSHE